MAREHSGCEVWEKNFLALQLPENYFDGVFANSSLFHVPARELPRVLRELNAWLKPGGAIVSSKPHGNDKEGWRAAAGAYLGETWRRFVADAGFEEIDHYYRPDGLPREQQPWLALWRKTQARTNRCRRDPARA
jgi:SAM-dependent methyltransferase